MELMENKRINLKITILKITNKVLNLEKWKIKRQAPNSFENGANRCD